MKTNVKKANVKTSVKRMLVGTAAALLAAAPAIAAPAMAAPANLDKADTHVGQMLTAQNPHGSCAVIAHLDGALTLARQESLTALHADITRHLGFIQSVALTLPARNLSKLAALPFVTHLSYDGAVRKMDGFTDASSGAAFARQQYSLTGKGVTVAVVDSGISIHHPDLLNPDGSSRVTAYPDFTGGWQTTVTDDYCGHATHVAGIVGGNGAESSSPDCTHTFYGVAPQTNLVSVRVLDQYGVSSVSTVLAGLQWVLAHHNDNKAAPIRVVNLSLGHPVGDYYTNDPLCQAVEAVWKAGIVVVCAAGNNGRASLINTPSASNEGWGTAYGSIQSPANDPYVITVGATKSMDGNRADDLIATYSSRGPSRLDNILKPDIIAPGNKVISLDVDWSTLNFALSASNLVPYSAYFTDARPGQAGYTMCGPGGWAYTDNRIAPGYSDSYMILSGTSMAAPVVAGAAALMLQANPKLTPDMVKARMMASADKWTDSSGAADPCTYGAGYLNIPAALASTVTPIHCALSPRLLHSAGSIRIDTSTIGSASVWGSKALTGVNSIYGSKALTGVNTIYGSKALTGVNTLYGSSVWSDKTLSGSTSAAVDLSSITLQGE